MEFKKLNGYVGVNSSYISIQISGGDNNNSISDQVWISKDGTEMEISEHIDFDVFEETCNLFKSNSKTAFRGAMRRMGVYFD